MMMRGSSPNLTSDLNGEFTPGATKPWICAAFVWAFRGFRVLVLGFLPETGALRVVAFLGFH